VASWKTKLNRMTERLIFKVLAHCRIKRVAVEEKKYVSVSTQLIRDANCKLYDPTKKVRKWEVEWFMGTQEELARVCQQVVDAVNQWE